MAKCNMLAATAIALVTALPAFAQEAAAPAAEAAPALDSALVVAQVNGTDITLGELVDSFAALPEQYRALPGDVLLPNLLDQLVQQQLLADQVKEVPAHIEVALKNDRREYLASDAVQTLLADAITDEALQKAYDEAFADAVPGQEFSAAHVLVATQEEADAVVARLAAGEDFATVAKEISTDTGSGANGGELGWFTADMMVEPFGTKVTELAEAQKFDEVSEPVESQFGFHVIKLHEARAQSLPTISEIRGELENKVRQDTLMAKLAELEAAGAVTRTDLTSYDPAALLNTNVLTQD